MSIPPVALESSETASLRLGYSRRMRDRDGRWRSPHLARRAAVVLGVLALLANFLWVIGLQHVMIVTPMRDRSTEAIQVRVIEPVQPVPLPDEPQPAVFQRRPSRVAITPPKARLTPPPPPRDAPETTSARIGAAGDVPIKLFKVDGSLVMPEATTRIGPARIDNPKDAAAARWADIEKRGDNPLDCTRTRFAGSFRRDESLGDEVSRKYLSWIGLADQAGIAERAAAKAKRAADGCDPAG